MIFEEQSFGVQCDNCLLIYEESGTGYCLQVSEDNLHPEDDGWHVDDGKHYCPDCHYIDDEDKLHIANIPPVYIIIADFPGNKDFPVGKKITFEAWPACSSHWQHKVTDCQGERIWLSHYFEDFPHIFKRVYK